jgi:hypothetical protein
MNSFFFILYSLFLILPFFPFFSIKSKETFNTHLHLTLSNVDALNIFYEFIEKFNKNYHSFNALEERFNIFTKNLGIIVNYNQDNKKNFIIGINEFTDLTREEFKNLYIIYYLSLQSFGCKTFYFNIFNNISHTIVWTSTTDDIGICGIVE